MVLRFCLEEDVPKKDWEKKGVWVLAPPYGLGKYNNSFCKIRETENELFYLRMRREDPPLRTTATILMNSVGITHDIVKSNLLKCLIFNFLRQTMMISLTFLDQKIVKTQSTEIIDLQFFAKYQPKSGFKFALDGFHNVPDKSIPYVGLFCLNHLHRYIKIRVLRIRFT